MLVIVIVSAILKKYTQLYAINEIYNKPYESTCQYLQQKRDEIINNRLIIILQIDLTL